MVDTDRVWQIAWGAFALWTLVCHVTVFTGGDLLRLGATSLVALPLAALVLHGARRRMARELRPPPLRMWRCSGPLAIALLLGAGAISFCWDDSPVSLYRAGLVLLALAVVALRREKGEGPLHPEPRERTRLVVALAVVCAATTLVAHRPDHDDCLYLNLAVSAADAPRAPLLAADGIHGIPGTPLLLPTYRLLSLPLLEALLSRLGLPVLVTAHLLVPPLAAVLAVLAWSSLLRRLAPRRHGLTLATVCLFLAMDGSAHGSWGNLAFVRLFQGKAIFLTALLPALLATLLRFVADPTLARALLLAALVVSATGLGPSAGVVATGLSLLVLGSSPLWRRPFEGRVLAGLIALLPALLPLLLLGTETRARLMVLPAMALPSSVLAERSLVYVLGHGARRTAALALVLAGLVVTRTGEGAILALLLPAAFFGLLWNVDLLSLLGSRLPGAVIHWRVFWFLPLPLLVALAAGGLDGRDGEGDSSPRRAADALAALLAVFILLSGRPTLSGANGTRIAWPGPKIDEGHTLARWVTESTKPGTRILAPPDVSPWLPTLPKRTRPLVARRAYAEHLAPYVGEDRTRRWLVLWRGLDPGETCSVPLEILREELGVLGGVCFHPSVPDRDDLERTLGEGGLRRAGTRTGLVLWLRPEAKALSPRAAR